MTKPLSQKKIAILVANGFHEQDLTYTQRILQTAGANTRIVGMDSGLVNSWTGDAWGHHFATDFLLNSALAADFSMLVVPGGRRSIEKLKLTAHTKRFIGGFMDANKPVAILNDAIELAAFAERIEGRTVSAPEQSADVVAQAGAQISDEQITYDGNLMSGYADSIEETVQAIYDHFTNICTMKVAA